MITRWYIGFTGDYPGRTGCWFDIFTEPKFRHVLALGYDPMARTYVLYEPTVTGTLIEVIPQDGSRIDQVICSVAQYGRWLKFEKRPGGFLLGGWRMYCVPAVKHLVGLKSCALTPKQLYRDLLRAGGQPIFEESNSNG